MANTIEGICVLLVIGLGVCSAAIHAHFNDICQPSLRDKCSNMTDAIICYDDKMFATWCNFLNAGCDGKLPGNVSTIHQPLNTSCKYVFTIRVHVTTAPHTHAPTTISPFEQHLSNAAVHGIDDLLIKANTSGASIDIQKKIFSVQDHTHKHYVRNSQCWAYPLDLTPISPWNSQGHNRKAGTLISPKHAIWARHYSMKVNTTLRFVDRDNNVVDRRITKTHAIPTEGHAFLSGYDIVVGELDRDVPSSISFAKVLPHDLRNIRFRGTKVPIFDTDFEEKALVADFNYETEKLVWLGRPSTSSIRYPYFETKIKGDSGNPVFLVLDGQLVLVFVFTYGGSGGGTSISYHTDAINAIIKGWGSGYQLTSVDLSRYLDSGTEIPHIIG